MSNAFNLSQLANNVNTSGQVSASTGVSGTLPVANGGTGRTTNTAYAVICGGTTNGGVEQSIASVGSAGQVLTSNGAGALPTFQNAAAGGGGFSNMQVFGSSGTFTVPAGITKVKVTVVGGGGNGSAAFSACCFSVTGSGGGGGGTAIEIISGLTPGGTVSVTVGGAGGTSSFGAFCSATGGGAGTTNAPTNEFGGGVGGMGSGGNLNIKGQGGGAGNSYTSSGGLGGSSTMGGGGDGGVSNGVRNSSAGGNYGGGGGGGISSSGGSGAAGVVVVEY